MPTPDPTPSATPGLVGPGLTAAEGLSNWDRLWPVLLAATLAFVAAVAVQLWLVPEVDKRKRRAARNEEAILTLGKLLVTGDYIKTLRHLNSASMAVSFARRTTETEGFMAETAAGVDMDAALRVAEALKLMHVEVMWLADRVQEPDDSRYPDLVRDLDIAHERLQHMTDRNQYAEIDAPDFPDPVDDLCSAMATAVEIMETLTDEVRRMARGT